MTDDRRSVKTYVPAHQKSEWERHADDLGMSQSEFVRTMVQAGRRGFTMTGTDSAAEGASEDVNPGGDTLETRIETVLERGPTSWEELLTEISADLEDRLEETLESLQERNRVRYSGREGGYTLIDE